MENSQPVSKKNKGDMTEEQLTAATLQVIDFLLGDMHNKRKLKKVDIVTYALDHSSKQYSVIFKRAKDILSSVYGIQIVRLPSKVDEFIMVNNHQNIFMELTSGDNFQHDVQESLVLQVVLASIFMNRGRMYESHLQNILEIIGFKNHAFYGSSEKRSKDYIHKLINHEFVKQMYLEARTVPRPETAQNPPLPEGKATILQWGFRALIEIDVDKIADYVTKIYDGKNPTFFPTMYYNELKEHQHTLRNQTSNQSSNS